MTTRTVNNGDHNDVHAYDKTDKENYDFFV